MSIQKYRAFLTTVEHKSLTKAAQTLGYTQPGISLMISSLEQEFGFPLLVRTKDGVIPTEDAQYLQPYMQQIVSTEDTLVEASHRLKGIEMGKLRVGAFTSTCSKWLPEIISTFLSAHPNIDLRIFEGTYGAIQEQLINGTLDMAITSQPIPNNYDFLPLCTDPILAVLSKDNPLSACDAIHLQDLVQYPFIVPNEGADESVQYVLKSENLTPHIRFRIKGDMATISMIERGLGVSLIPKLAIIFPSEHIAVRPLVKTYSRTLGICIRSMKCASPLANAFIQAIKDFIENVWQNDSCLIHPGDSNHT